MRRSGSSRAHEGFTKKPKELSFEDFKQRIDSINDSLTKEVRDETLLHIYNIFTNGKEIASSSTC